MTENFRGCAVCKPKSTSNINNFKNYKNCYIELLGDHSTEFIPNLNNVPRSGVKSLFESYLRRDEKPLNIKEYLKNFNFN